MHLNKLWMIGCVAAFGASACEQRTPRNGEAQPGAATQQEQPVQQEQQAQQEQELSDAQIVAAAEAINRGEIQLGQLALNKSMAPAVRNYAQRMIDEHGQSQQQLEQIAQRLNVTAEQGQLSQQLTQESQQVMQQLQGQSGEQFDTAYINAMVQLHESALRVTDDQLVKQVDAGELRDHLQSFRGVLSSHHDAARDLRTGAGGAGGVMEEVQE